VLLTPRVTQGGDILDTLRFLRSDGTLVRSYRLPFDANLGGTVTVGGDRVFFSNGAELRSVGSSGSATDHGSLEGVVAHPSTFPGQVQGLVVSPDGRSWVWGVTRPLAKHAIRSLIYLGGVGRSPKVIFQETSDDGTSQVAPVLWLAAGVVLVKFPLGLGGLIVFPDTYWGDSRLLDPRTLRLKVLTKSTEGCPLNDVAQDGSWTCVGGVGQGGPTYPPTAGRVQLHGADGSSRVLTVNEPLTEMGNAIVNGTGASAHLAVGLFTGVDDATFSAKTIVFDLATGGSHRVGATWDVPAAWLPDGSLVLQAVVIGPSQSLCTLLHPDGTTVRLGSGRFLGYFDHQASVPAR